MQYQIQTLIRFRYSGGEMSLAFSSLKVVPLGSFSVMSVQSIFATLQISMLYLVQVRSSRGRPQLTVMYAMAERSRRTCTRLSMRSPPLLTGR